MAAVGACAGFGAGKDSQGIFSTFCAFLEMCCSEITMARLNHANVLCHFSHSGVDDMADNTMCSEIDPAYPGRFWCQTRGNSGVCEDHDGDEGTRQACNGMIRSRAFCQFRQEKNIIETPCAQ